MASALVLEGSKTRFEVGLSTGEAAIDELGEEVSHGGNGFRCSEASSKAAVAISESGLRGLEGLGCKSQGARSRGRTMG